MRVFISSTCYDLIDIRAELAEHLKNMGITPVLSDDKLSDFKVSHDVNSIETCLINVDSCNEVLLILDRRYGPALEKYGYGEFSATHLEYRRAIEKKIPVRVYVRDRLEADFSIWKRNDRNNEVNFSWISKKDIGLFTLLDTHSPLESDATTSNWYSIFTNSIDLKAAVTKHFEKQMLPKRLIEAIQNNNFPIISVSLQNPSSTTQNGSTTAHFRLSITNVSNAPAFNLNAVYMTHKETEKIFSPSRNISTNFSTHYSAMDAENVKKEYLKIEYESPISILIRERFSANGAFIDRKYYPSSGITIEIEDDTNESSVQG